MNALYIKTVPQWVPQLASIRRQLYHRFRLAKATRVGIFYFFAVGLLLASPAALYAVAPGNALSFNGSNQYVTVPYDATLNSTNQFTAEAWANVGGGSGTFRTVIGNRWPNSPLGGFLLRANHLNQWDVIIGDGVWKQIIGANIVLNQWAHLAATYDGTTARFYLNGVLQGTLPVTLVKNMAQPFTIGSYNDAAQYFFNGQLDEVRIWNVALTQAQIQTNMHKTMVGNETGLEAYYNFDEGSGTTLTDLTGHGHHGTLVNSPSWTTSGAMCPFPISASNVTSTSFTANWNAVSGATGYRLDVSTDPNFGSFLPNGSNLAMPVGTSFNVTGLTLTSGTPYYYRLRVEKGGWTSPNSATVSFLFPPGNALQFDGTNYLTAPADFSSFSEYTIEAWVKPTATTVSNIIANTDGVGPGYNSQLGINGSGKFEQYLYDDYGGHLVTGTTTVIANQWYHVAITATTNSPLAHLYVNGIEDATPLTVGNFPPYLLLGANQQLNLAGSFGAYLGNFTGLIDEVRLWNVARTQTQIQSNMHRTLVGNEAGLVTYYNFDQSSGTLLPDRTGHGHDGTLVNGPPWTAATWKYGYPYVTTGTVSALTATTASVGGTVVDAGIFSPVTASGICYATSASPTTPCTTDGPAGIGTIPGALTSLTPQGTTYYARAYATNSAGTIYSYASDVTFTTRYLPVIAQGTSVSVTMDEDGSPTAWSTPTISATDTESDTMTWTLATPATNGTATVSGTGASPTITYSPTANYNGADSFVVQVADSDGVATITVNVTINPINDAPVASASNFTTTENNAVLNQTLFASDIDADSLTYSIVTNGSIGSATITNASTGAFTYTPNANQNGTDTITFKVNDGTVDSNPGTITITITPAPPVPVIPPPVPVIPSPVLVPPLPPMTLKLSLAGTGTGHLTSVPVGIDCSTTAAACAYTVTAPTWVTLTALPDEGSQFSSWSGDPACQADGKVFVLADTACQATFELESYELTVGRLGQGQVTGPGLDCPPECTATVLYGTEIQLEAVADREWIHTGWKGRCDQTGKVKVTNAYLCHAVFEPDLQGPNLGDGNGDGVADAYQPNVISLPDKVSGNYVTFAVQPDTCVISDVYTDLPDNYGQPEKNKPMPQGLIYFELACPQAQVSLYYHAVKTVKRNFIFRKYGPLVPGEEPTMGWYLLPNVTFEAVMIGGNSAVKASYTLTDGELGDSTGVDGRIVDPAGIMLK